MKRLAATLAVLLGLLASPALAEPEVFSKSGFKADEQAALAGQKLHIAYFTATWCPPCKKMKAETWVDEKVESWADANAIITPVDTDEQPALASQYRIRSIPTTVVLLGDKEIGRVSGYLPPDAFVEWLDGYRASHLDPARRAAGAPIKPAPGAGGEGAPMIAPAEAGAGLSAADALAMYARELRSDATGLGVTGSLLVPRLAELVSTDADLKAQLAERVRTLSENLSKQGAAGAQDVREFLQLAPVAGMRDEALAWVDAQLAEGGMRDLVEKNALLAADLYAEAGRYAEAQGLVGDPMQHARKLLSAASRAGAKSLRELDESLAGAFETGQAELIRRELANAVVMALASGEEAKAKAIARLFPGGEAAKDQQAIDAAAARAGVEPIRIAD